MAPTVAICRSSSDSHETIGFAKRSVASGIWVCQPVTNTLPPMSGGVVTSCATLKKAVAGPALDAVALDLSRVEDEGEEAYAVDTMSVCETPKAKKYRIPVVDVDMCPPAPKKVRRAHGRLPGACSSERDRANFLQKLSFSRNYLF